MTFHDLPCILCGSPIGREHFPNWMGRFRALYTLNEDWDGGRISGLGERRQDDESGICHEVIPLDPSIDEDLSLWMKHDGHVRIEPFKSRFLPKASQRLPVPIWGFQLHSPCWDMLSTNLGDLDRRDAIRALFHLCRSQPINSGLMDWGHNYGGTLKRGGELPETVPGHPSRLIISRFDGPEYLKDPSEILQTLRELQTKQQSSNWPSQAAARELLPISAGTTDPFRLLPQELLSHIMIQLDSIDVTRARLASKFLANVELSDSFWRSRFLPGHELGHLAELIEYQDSQRRRPHWRWRILYALAHLHDSNPAMVNRKRIWSLASGLRSMVELRLAASTCHGDPYSNYFNGGLPLCPDFDTKIMYRNLDPQGFAQYKLKHWCCSAYSTVLPSGQFFNEGSRSLWEVTTTFKDSITGIGVSFVQLNGKSYIAGLAFTTATGTKLFGYQHSTTSHQALIGSLAGFRLAMDARGVRGIRFITTLTEHGWVGDYAGLPKTILTGLHAECGRSWPVEAIKGGFDALKLVTVSIACHGHLEEGNEKLTGTTRQMLWYPEVPDPGLDILIPSRYNEACFYQPQTFCCRHVCVFGGKQGHRLPYLRRITAWYSEGHANLLWALHFEFEGLPEDESSWMLGQIPGPDTWQAGIQTPNIKNHSITLDSASGERITRIDGHDHRWQFPNFFSVHTNFGRKLELPPLPKIITTGRSHSMTWSLTPDTGIIIGLHAVLDPCEGLKYIGSICADASPDDAAQMWPRQRIGKADVVKFRIPSFHSEEDLILGADT